MDSERAGLDSRLELPLAPRSPSEPVPLAYTQYARWLAFRAIGMSCNTRSCAVALRLTGPLRLGSIRRSFSYLLHRHEALRTRISVRDGFPVQRIVEGAQETLEQLDLTAGCPERGAAHMRALVEETINAHSDMASAPPIAARLLRLGPDQHVLVIAVDHMVCDGVSLDILLRDLFALYGGDERNPSLPALPIQFADYAVWQRKTGSLRTHRNSQYWADRLRGVPRLSVPATPPPTEQSQPAWANVFVRLDACLRTGLLDLARKQRTMLPIAVLACYIGLLSRWSGQYNPLVGLHMSGRDRVQLRHTIGFFAYPLYLRVTLNPRITLVDLLREVAAEYRSALHHQDFGAISCDPCYSWVWGCPTFNWRSISASTAATSPADRAAPGLSVRPLRFERRAPEMQSSVDLPIYGGQPWILLMDAAAGISAQIKYRPARFTAESMTRFGANLRSFARTLVARPYEKLCFLPYE